MALADPVAPPQSTSDAGRLVEPPEKPEWKDELPPGSNPRKDLHIRVDRITTLRVTPGTQWTVVTVVHPGGDVIELEASVLRPPTKELEPRTVLIVLPENVVRHSTDVAAGRIVHEDRSPLLGLFVTQPMMVPQPLDRPLH